MLLVDCAPTALIVARIAGIPAASVGMGFWLPPAMVPIPAYRDWEPVAKGRVEHAEQQVPGNVNAVLARHGAAPLAALWQLFSGDLPLSCSWPEIDHHARPDEAHTEWLGPNFLPHSGLAPTWPIWTAPRPPGPVNAAHPRGSTPSAQRQKVRSVTASAQAPPLARRNRAVRRHGRAWL